jgi:hypothetical protein
MILLDGMEWQNSNKALRKLKQMLWGFVAFRESGDKLENAIETITKARKHHNGIARKGTSKKEEWKKMAPNLVSAAN